MMTHAYRMNIKKETTCSRGSTFSWFLNLDAMLMVGKSEKMKKKNY
jgi:hypothetical protein